MKVIELSPEWVAKCYPCQHWPATSRGCTIPEDKLDGRGEPAVGQPHVCRYFDDKGKHMRENA